MKYVHIHREGEGKSCLLKNIQFHYIIVIKNFIKKKEYKTRTIHNYNNIIGYI